MCLLPLTTISSRVPDLRLFLHICQQCRSDCFSHWAWSCRTAREGCWEQAMQHFASHLSECAEWNFYIGDSQSTFLEGIQEVTGKILPSRVRRKKKKREKKDSRLWSLTFVPCFVSVSYEFTLLTATQLTYREMRTDTNSRNQKLSSGFTQLLILTCEQDLVLQSCLQALPC